MATGTIRFQRDGVKHKLDKWEFSSLYLNEGWYLTKCNQKCLLMGDIGRMAVQPPKTNCKECFNGD